MYKMSSVALPACCLPRNYSVLIDPRYIILMLRPPLEHAIRRLRLVLIRPSVVCEQDFGAPCSIDWVFWLAIFTTIHSGMGLLATVMMDRVQTRRSHLTVGHQRGKCTGSNCVRPSGLASVGCLCLMFCVCWVGNVFVVQSVNGVILLLVQMVGASTIEMCACRTGMRRVLQVGRMVFSLRPCVFFDVGVRRREQDFKQHDAAVEAR